MGASTIEMISAQLSKIEAQLIPGDLASEIAMEGGADVSLVPLHHILGWGSTQLITIGAQLNQPDLTLKFGMGKGAGRHSIVRTSKNGIYAFENANRRILLYNLIRYIGRNRIAGSGLHVSDFPIMSL